jgi:hypothetical protein
MAITHHPFLNFRHGQGGMRGLVRTNGGGRGLATCPVAALAGRANFPRLAPGDGDELGANLLRANSKAGGDAFGRRHRSFTDP